MPNRLITRSHSEEQFFIGAAEIDACFAALPMRRRETLSRLIDSDFSRSLDLLEAELKLFRQSRLEVDHART